MPVGGGRRDSDLSDAFLSPEAYRATQAVEFIAEHLRNEDEYVQVGPIFIYVIIKWRMAFHFYLLHTYI